MMIKLENGRLQLSLHEPEGAEAYYRGTRFDRAGVFASVLFDGVEYAQEWFEKYDPYMHDAVCGPSEEFSPIFRGGGRFLKPGVGVLSKPEDEEYDHFKLYPILDAGVRRTAASEDKVDFFHILDGIYEYRKTVAMDGTNGFTIDHELLNTGTELLDGDMYNHNFFTFGNPSTGPSRRFDFPFRPDGDWRTEYDSVALSANGIRFCRGIEKGESVFMGNLHACDCTESLYSFVISDRVTGGACHPEHREGSAAIEVRGDAPVFRYAFWANHRIACLEPFVHYRIATGEAFRLHIRYRFVNE